MPHFPGKLCKLLKNEDFKQKYLGFVLEHDYSLSTLTRSTLKGNDKLLFDYLEGAKKFVMKLIPIEIVDYGPTEYYRGNFIQYVIYKINATEIRDITDQENELSKYRLSKLYDTAVESNKVFFLVSYYDF